MNGNLLTTQPFEKPQDCSSYFVCVHGQLTTMSCPSGTSFNSKTSVCDRSENVPGCN